MGNGKMVVKNSRPRKSLEPELNEMAKDGSITMSYVHIKNQKQQKIPGMDFGQKLEPAGEYMSTDTSNGKNKVDLPNYEYGEIHFSKPLVLEHKSTSSTGWKKRFE